MSEDTPLIEKVCSKCGNTFLKKATASTAYCSSCYSEYRKKRYAEGKDALTPEMGRDRNLRQNYGITLEQYNQLLAQQFGVCAICGKPELRFKGSKKGRGRGVSRELSVDHDHKTGKVRALLCNDCNVALGLIEREPRRMQGIARYIRKHKPKSESYQQLKDLFSLDEEAAD